MPSPIEDIRKATALAGTGAIVLGGLLDSFFGTRRSVASISNPSKFTSNVLNKHAGLATTNRHMMFITLPKCFQQNASNPQETKVVPTIGGINQQANINRNPADLIRDIPFFCMGCNTPNMSLETHSYYPQGYGALSEVATGQRFGDVDATFYVDASGVIQNFFHKWMQNIVNYNATSPSAGGSFKGAYPFEFFYKDEYKTTVQIVVYNQQSDVVVVYELREAYPAHINPTSLNWEADDQIMLLPITFKYTSWVSNTLYENNTTSAGRSLSATDILIRSGTAAQVVAGMLKKPTSIGDLINVGTNAMLLKQAVTL